MPSAPPPEDPSDPPRRDRVRLTAVAGTVAALAVAASFFLPWITVDPSLGEHVREDIARALEEADTTTSAERDFERLAETLATQGALAGTDIIQWVRTAQAYGRDMDAEAASVGPADAALARYLTLSRIVLYGLPLGALLIGVYFLLHRFRRAGSPILILSLLTGAVAVGLAGALDYAYALVERTLGSAAGQVHLGGGLGVLLAGAAGLTLASVFGVTTRNWLRVYAGSFVTGACLAFIAWRYLARGDGP